MRFGGPPMTPYRTTNVQIQGRHCWFKHADGILSTTNSDEKRMGAISNHSEAFALETLAGLLTDIEPLQVDEATLN
jgi:hypothetical protein